MTIDRLEKRDEEYLRKACVRRGWQCHKWVGSAVGLPDRVILAPGGIVWLVELKRFSGERSAAQRVIHEKFSRLGTHVHTLAGRDEVDAWLAWADEQVRDSPHHDIS